MNTDKENVPLRENKENDVMKVRDSGQVIGVLFISFCEE